LTVTNPEPLPPGEDTAFEPAIEPYCTVDGLKRRAKLLRSVLDPAKTIKLSRAQSTVLRCIGHATHDVFSGRRPPTPLFPAHVQRTDRRDYQRLREISTLSELLPDLELATIVEFVSSWNLVHWREVPLNQILHSDRLRDDQPSLLVGQSCQARAGITASQVLPRDIAFEEAKLSSYAMPSPVEQFMPPTIDFASEKAVALATLASLSSRGFAYCVTARVYGFASWADLEASFKLASRSRFDEEVTARESSRRRKWQAQALEALLSLDHFSAIELISVWKPTSSSLRYGGNLSWNAYPERRAPKTDSRQSARIIGTLSAKSRTADQS